MLSYLTKPLVDQAMRMLGAKPPARFLDVSMERRNRMG
jgi:hypothetical protein